MRPHTDTQSDLSTVTPTSSLTAYVIPTYLGPQWLKGGLWNSKLRLGLGDLLRRCIRSLRFLGQDSPPVGAFLWNHHPTICWTHQRRPLRLLLRRQQTNCFRLSRSNHQAVEHPR